MRDRFHFKGEFVSWAHNEFIMSRKFWNYISIFAHVKFALQGYKIQNRATVIPKMADKHIALENGVFTDRG